MVLSFQLLQLQQMAGKLGIVTRKDLAQATVSYTHLGSKNATQQQVAFIENWINNYPKKLFNYKSPKEFLQTG